MLIWGQVLKRLKKINRWEIVKKTDPLADGRA